MFRGCFASFVLIFSLVSVVPGQDTGGGDQGSSGGGSGGAKGFQRPMFITGRVIHDDGSIPERLVKVELICEGNVVRQVQTDTQGGFTIQINFGRGAKNEAHAFDASVHRGIAAHTGSFNTDQTGPGALGSSIGSVREDRMGLSFCELRAEESGYVSDILTLGLRQAHDQGEVGVITLSPTIKPDAATVSVNTLKAPKQARRAFSKATRELEKGDQRDRKKILRELRKAVAEYPEFSDAWLLMGETHMDMGDTKKARTALGKARTAEPEFTLPYLALAQLELNAGNMETAAQLSNRATKLSPDHPRGHYLNALTNSALGNLALAEASAKRVHDGRYVVQFPGIHYVLGWVFSQKGDYAEAASEYHHYLELLPDTPTSVEVREQIDRWEALGLIPAANSNPEG